VNIAIALWAYAAALAFAGGFALRRSRWVDRAPRLAIAAWQALTASIVLAVAFGGLALVVPHPMVSAGLAGFVDACAMALQAQYATPGGAALATAGLVLAIGVLGRWTFCVADELARGRQARRRHREMLAIIGRPGAHAGITLLEHDAPAAYCVAGRPHRIVLTTAADEALDDAQLAAVLAHERAHLRGRHDLAVGAATGLARAFRWLRVFGQAQREVARLVELLADDHAVRSTHRLTLAEAMLTLAGQATPRGALAAGGPSAGSRIRRLITGRRPLAAWATTLGMTAAAAILALPLITLSTPAVTAGDCCAEHRSAQAVEDCHIGREFDSCEAMPAAAG
jgi:Zn-dependent protease with chaperone function